MIEKNLTDEELLDITGGEAFLADESLIFPINKFDTLDPWALTVCLYAVQPFNKIQ